MLDKPGSIGQGMRKKNQIIFCNSFFLEEKTVDAFIYASDIIHSCNSQHIKIICASWKKKNVMGLSFDPINICDFPIATNKHLKLQN